MTIDVLKKERSFDDGSVVTLFTQVGPDGNSILEQTSLWSAIFWKAFILTDDRMRKKWEDPDCEIDCEILTTIPDDWDHWTVLLLDCGSYLGAIGRKHLFIVVKDELNATTVMEVLDYLQKNRRLWSNNELEWAIKKQLIKRGVRSFSSGSFCVLLDENGNAEKMTVLRSKLTDFDQTSSKDFIGHLVCRWKEDIMKQYDSLFYTGKIYGYGDPNQSKDLFELIVADDFWKNCLVNRESEKMSSDGVVLNYESIEFSYCHPDGSVSSLQFW